MFVQGEIGEIPRVTTRGRVTRFGLFLSYGAKCKNAFIKAHQASRWLLTAIEAMEQEKSDSKICVVMPSASWVIRQAGRYTILSNTQPEKFFFFFLFLARSSSDIYDERLRKRSKRRLVWPKR